MNERQEYIDKLAAQLKEWDNEIEKLQAKVKHSSQDVKEKYQAEMANIIKKRDAAKSKLTEIQQSTLEAWKELKPGLENSWSELKNAISNAWAKFSSSKNLFTLSLNH